jgi:hypothetical protein
MKKASRSTAEKIKIYRSLFTGLINVYGTYDSKTGRVHQEKNVVTDEVILSHLAGKQSYGVYLLKEDKTNALAVDFDHDELSEPLSFVKGAEKYAISAYIERSKSKGYHVWMFFEKPVLARKARLVAKKILDDIGKPQTEIFPKQDELIDGVSYGNFVDPGQPVEIYPDQWELLENIRLIPELRLDAIIESCKLEKHECITKTTQSNNHTVIDSDVSQFGLPPCVRSILAEGVKSNQRVSCFRLAVQLKRNGIPFDLALVMLKAWALKNRPEDGKRVITTSEIEYQTKCAFENTYRSVGCEEPAISAYCNENCPLYSYRTGKNDS